MLLFIKRIINKSLSADLIFIKDLHMVFSPTEIIRFKNVFKIFAELESEWNMVEWKPPKYLRHWNIVQFH